MTKEDLNRLHGQKLGGIREYVLLYPWAEACLDGTFTSFQLRRIADVLDGIALAPWRAHECSPAELDLTKFSTECLEGVLKQWLTETPASNAVPAENIRTELERRYCQLPRRSGSLSQILDCVESDIARTRGVING